MTGPTVRPDDEPLRGGVNEVVRRGDTVIRPAGPHSASVHRLLRHVRAAGFEGGPDVIDLGVDARIETLTFVPGEVTGYPVSPPFRTDRALESAAVLLRDFHDASVGFPTQASDRWGLPTREPVEVICHGDFAPYNCAVTDGDVTGVFDFDTAHPGPRLWDVGYAAYRWAPLTDPDGGEGFGTTTEQARRLRLFCASYGTDDLNGVIAAAADRLHALVDMMRTRAAAGNAAFAEHVADGHDLLYLNDIAYFTRNATRLSTGTSGVRHQMQRSRGFRSRTT